ncbi:hypothetical protein Tco_0900617 [Tanacetum coccineum]
MAACGWKVLTSPRRTIKGPGRRRTAPGESPGPAQLNYASTNTSTNVCREMEKLAGGTQNLCGCLKHTQICNIEGKLLGKDGKPLMPIRTKAIRGASLTQEETIVEPLIGNEPDLDNSFWNSAPVIDKEATTDATIEKTDSQCMGSKSYVNVVAAAKPNPKLNFRTWFNKDKVEHSDFVLPVENVMAA